MDRLALDPAAVQHRLTTPWRVQVVESLGSTNAALLADADAPDLSVLAAEEQTAGRGRLDRSWSSPPRAGLLFSVRMHPTPPIATWGWLPLLAGVALHEAVGAVAGVAVALKWPNDLLCTGDERKLAGILAQTSGEAVVVGIGLNVSTTREELPIAGATSLELCRADAGLPLEPPLDRAELLAAVLDRFAGWTSRWSATDGDAEACGLADAYRAACATLGREVTVHTTDGVTLQGVAAAIDHDGRLQVTTNEGTTVVGAGDVYHLRPH